MYSENYVIRKNKDSNMSRMGGRQSPINPRKEIEVLVRHNRDTSQALRPSLMERLSNIGHILLHKMTQFSNHGLPKGHAPTMNFRAA